MSKDREFYRDIDRIIRIIYKETFMLEHINYYNQGLIDFSFDSFDLSNPVFRERIKRSYIKYYSNNYHLDDIEFLLEDVTNQLNKEYGSSNSLYLIEYISKKILHRDSKEFYVDFDDLLEWDGFINKIDMKLFVAARLSYFDDYYDEHTTSVIHHNNQYIYDICKRTGISENHMHLKASGYVTDINWYAFLMGSVFDKKAINGIIEHDGIYRDRPKNRKGERTSNDKSNLTQYLIKIRFLRIVLENMVDGGRKISEAYTEDNIMRILKSNNVEVTAQTIKFSKEYSNETEMLANQIKKDFEKYIKTPLRERGEDSSKYLKIEINFLRKTFKTIHQKRKKNIFLIFLFNLYICGMTDLKFQIIQDNLGMGFDKFKEKEDNKKVFIKDKLSNEDLIRSAFHKYYREKYVKNIEFRIGPEDKAADYFKELKNLAKVNDDEWEKAKKELNNNKLSKINYGIIVHFIKQKYIRKFKDKTEESSEQEITIYEASNYINDRINKRRDLETKSNKLIEALKRINYFSTKDKTYATTYQGKIVGIDTANYEKDNRPYLYSTVFRKLKSLFPDLHSTYHVGEEFPTLSNGLRAIDEVLNFCDYHANDRLGHALALGIDVEDYYEKKRKNILCNLGDYLDDIIWMYSVLYQSNRKEDYYYLSYLKGQFESNKQFLYLKDNIQITFHDYYDAYFLKGDSPEIYLHMEDKCVDIDVYEKLCKNKKHIYRINYNHPYHKAAFLNENAREIYIRSNFDNYFVSSLNEPFKGVVSNMFIDCVKRTQELLKHKILEQKVFIEANPTSNKKIAYLDKYIKLPALNLNRQYLKDADKMINLPISINTDDSSIFQTNLVNEYSMIGAALMREGYDQREVYDYLENLAIASNVHSFVKNK